MVSILFEGISLDSCEHYTADTAKLVQGQKTQGQNRQKPKLCNIVYALLHSEEGTDLYIVETKQLLC